MAIRLEKAFGVDMETMLALQHAYDVAAARTRAASIRLSRYKTSHGKNGRRKRAA
jgi:plasmid maintenance system antidote protein VapI